MADHAADGPTRPLRPGTVRLSPELAVRRANELTRWAWWTFFVFLVGIWGPLVAVAWHSPWRMWIALGIAMALVPWFGRRMAQYGWDQRDLDEQARTMGTWKVTGYTPDRSRITFIGHMIYDSHDHVGSLARMVHVDLDATD